MSALDASKKGRTIKVSLLDADQRVHGFLAAAFAGDRRFEWIGSYREVTEAFEYLPAQPAEVLLLGLPVSGMSVVECLHRLKLSAPATLILALGHSAESQRVAEVLREGASGYELKSAPPREIMRAVIDVIEGGVFLSQEAQRSIVDFFRRSTANRALKTLLTQREEEIWVCLLHLKEKDIAQHLNISTQTVHAHIKALYKKLGVHNRESAIRSFFGLY
jgi:two-component system nitrate/nitrite response regulator NarL